MRKKILRTGNYPMKYSEDVIVQAVKDYLSGKDEYDISKKLKCSPQTVLGWVARTGHYEDIRHTTIGYDWNLIMKQVK